MSNRRGSPDDHLDRDAANGAERQPPSLSGARAARPRVDADAISILEAVTAERTAAAKPDRTRPRAPAVASASPRISPALVLLLIGATMLLLVGYRLSTRTAPTALATTGNERPAAAIAPPVASVSASAPPAAPRAALIETVENAAAAGLSVAARGNASQIASKPAPAPPSESARPTAALAKAPAAHPVAPRPAADRVASVARPTTARPTPAAAEPTSNPSKAIVEPSPGVATADLIRKCEEFGPLEGLLCRIRICADLWGVDPACPAQSKPQSLTGAVP